ncbi:hypothetical protein C8R43DRAFT_965785 [Mycena crocata]|nr:hypothetical protein C8R43DRAFT_965785 [Mycena crocata]
MSGEGAAIQITDAPTPFAEEHQNSASCPGVLQYSPHGCRFVGVYRAADKCKLIRAQKLLEEMLDNRLLHDRRFTIALLCNLTNLARKAACCRLNSESANPPEFHEMQLLTWADGHRLFKFRDSCGEAAHKIIPRTKYASKIRGADTLFVWQKPEGHGWECGFGGEHGESGVPSWFEKHVSRVASKVRLLPTQEAADINIAPTVAAIDAYPLCRSSAAHDLLQLARAIGTLIEQKSTAWRLNLHSSVLYSISFLVGSFDEDRKTQVQAPEPLLGLCCEIGRWSVALYAVPDPINAIQLPEGILARTQEIRNDKVL